MPKEKLIELNTDIEKKIQEIDNTMSLEGMPLTEEFKKILRQCFYGTKLTTIERQKIIDRYKQIYD